MYRLYRPELVTVHTVQAAGTDAHPCFELARQWAKTNIDDDVDDRDVNILMNTDGHGRFWAHIRIWTDLLKGEYTTRTGAENSAQLRGFDEYTIAVKDSADDQRLRRSRLKVR